MPYLPRNDEPLTPAEVGSPAEKQQGGDEALLVVEDDAAVRGAIQEILQDLGYRVTTAANGSEALSAVEKGSLVPDLVITDVIMPGTSGTALTARLRRTLAGLKVLYMSGYTGGL